MFKRIIVTLIMILLPFTASAKLSDRNVRQTLEMRTDVLAQLYESNPEAKGLIAGSEGYAVFNNGGISLIVLSAGSGKGVVHDNSSGKDTFMRMATGGVGIGLGIVILNSNINIDDDKEVVSGGGAIVKGILKNL